MRQQSNGIHHRMEFESVTELAGWIDRTPRLHVARSVSERPPDHSWDLNLGWDGALAMAKAGGRWDEGGRKLRDAVVQATEARMQSGLPVLDWSPAGGVLDVPTWLAGDPECFEDDDEEDASTAPVVRIAADCGRSAMVNAEYVVNRGAAILSLIDAIEASGGRVELWAVDCGNKPDAIMDVRVCLKQATDHWEPATVAFGLVHPAYSRRIGFAVMERHPGLATLTHQAYGRPETLDVHREGFDLYFPSMLGRCPEYGTPESAMDAVQAIYWEQVGEAAA